MWGSWVAGLWGSWVKGERGKGVKGALVVRVEDWVVLLGTLLNCTYLLCLLAIWPFFGCVFFIV